MADSQRSEQGFAVPGVELEFWPAHSPAFAAAVRLRGEHDMATSADLRAMMTSITGSVLVDLSDCTFLDSTVITVLIVAARDRERDGHRLELLAPMRNATITRTLQVSGVGDLLTVHEADGITTTGA